nr:DUF4403 family protein [Mesorhizobium sp.]
MLNIFRATLIAAVAAALPAHAGAPEGESLVVLPVTLNLAAAEARLNSDVPQNLHTIAETRECVPAKWFKTKFPPIKTKITPEINCDLSGSIDRNGPITLSGDGGALSVSFPVRASVTARGRGAIGQNIRQTATAAMTLRVVAVPTIDANWNPALSVDHTIRWDQKPTIKLFNLIEITITDKVEPKLQDAINAQKAKIPEILAKLMVPEKIAKLWHEVQLPRQVAQKPATWLVFEPKSVGFSGINVKDNILEARALVSGAARIKVGTSPSPGATPLPPLSTDVPADGAFRFLLPVSASLASLQQTVEAELEKLGAIPVGNGGSLGMLTLSNLRLSGQDGSIVVAVDALLDNDTGWLNRIDIFNWFAIKGTVTLTAKPVINDATSEITVEQLDFATNTDRPPVDALIEVFRLKPIRELLARLVRYDYGKDVATATAKANELLYRDLGEGLTLEGSLASVGFEQLQVDADSLTLPVRLEGAAAIKLGLD